MGLDVTFVTKYTDKEAVILAALEKWRANGKKLVFTNGCFDILHVGHVRYLTEARSLGDGLMVGVNSDESVSDLKGPSRPILPENERLELLQALRCVDFVCPFSEETPKRLIELVRPDILVKGGDWPAEKIVGGDFVKSYGGSVMSLPFVAGHSTTGIVERIIKGA